MCREQAYRVVIVEDLLSDRSELKDALSRLQSVRATVVAEAANGRDALERCREHKPDIVITDIEMPVMNGLQLARAIAVEFPGTRILFVTAHDHFEYARRALFLNVYAYLLKPVDISELGRCIGEICRDLSESERQEHEEATLRKVLDDHRSLLIDGILKDLVRGSIAPDEGLAAKLAFLRVPVNPSCRVLLWLVEIDDLDALSGSLPADGREALILAVFRRLRELHADWPDVVFARMDDSHGAGILHAAGSHSDEQLVERAVTRCREIEELFGASDISITIALSPGVTVFDHLPFQYERCDYILRSKYQVGKGRLLSIHDVPESASTAQIDMSRLVRNLRVYLNSGLEESALGMVRASFDDWSAGVDVVRTRGLSYSIIAALSVVLAEHALAIDDIMGLDHSVWDHVQTLETHSDAVAWVSTLIETVRSELAVSRESKSRLVVRRVFEAISVADFRNLTVGLLADSVGYSPTHLNRIVRAETGRSVSEHIHEQKMERAKARLSDPSVRLYEIAGELGFSHTAYFSAVFRKSTGMRPSEFRDACGGSS